MNPYIIYIHVHVLYTARLTEPPVHVHVYFFYYICIAWWTAEKEKRKTSASRSSEKIVLVRKKISAN